MNWVWSNTSNSKKQADTINQANEYIGIAKLYLHAEFEKSYSIAEPPIKKFLNRLINGSEARCK